MPADDRHPGVERRHRLEDRRPHARVLGDARALVVGQLLLGEEVVGDADLADVVQHGPLRDRLDLVARHAELLREARGILGDALHVPGGARVFVLQRRAEGHDDVLAGVELLAEVADLDQRADARAQLVLVDRLVEEVVRAAFQRLDLVVGIGERGEHEDGDHPPGRLALDARAGLVAVHVRHHHVEDDDRRVVLRIELQRFEPIVREDDVITPAPEVFLEELKVLLVVVDGEDELPFGRRRCGLRDGHGSSL